jgi:DNA topoisomerase-1
MKIILVKPDINKPDNWYYTDTKGTKVKDQKILDWIKSLRIPPMWRDVTIDTACDAIQTACGYDAKGRQQCLYSAKHIQKARKRKYCDLIKFGEQLPKIQGDISKYLEAQRWTKNKVISIILRIVMCCSFRLGTLKYENENESYGITTIRKRHISFNNTNKEASISFIGKKGVLNECQVCDPKISHLLKQLYDIKKSDDHIMMYQQGNEWIHIKHTDVNDFLHGYGETFTSKDFRTFTSNTLIIDLLRNAEHPNKLPPTKRKKQLNAAILQVASIVHNTKAVCQKDYIDPEILDLYLDHPITYRSKFITPPSDSRILFINWLKAKCL